MNRLFWSLAWTGAADSSWGLGKKTVLMTWLSEWSRVSGTPRHKLKSTQHFLRGSESDTHTRSRQEETRKREEISWIGLC